LKARNSAIVAAKSFADDDRYFPDHLGLPYGNELVGACQNVARRCCGAHTAVAMVSNASRDEVSAYEEKMRDVAPYAADNPIWPPAEAEQRCEDLLTQAEAALDLATTWEWYQRKADPAVKMVRAARDAMNKAKGLCWGSDGAAAAWHAVLPLIDATEGIWTSLADQVQKMVGVSNEFEDIQEIPQSPTPGEFHDNLSGGLRSILRCQWPELSSPSFARLIKCITGNPFQPVACELSWKTATVVALAQSIYLPDLREDERRSSSLRALADQLARAGCTNDAILAHCREADEHVHGCWVIDLLLGKE
jgi:hypothetical protein